MDRIDCFIIDDNEIDRRLIEEYATGCQELKISGIYNSAVESLEPLKINRPHLLIMDIDMPVISGVDLLRRLEDPPLCIFITSHVDYAPEAFDLHAIDFLVKPVSMDRFIISVARAFELINIKEKANNYDLGFENETLVIKEGNTINRIMINDIIYLEALTNYTKVVTVAKKYITLQNLKNFLDQLPADKFLRIHRSYAVAMQKVTKLQQGEINLGAITLPLGKTYKKTVKDTLGI